MRKHFLIEIFLLFLSFVSAGTRVTRRRNGGCDNARERLAIANMGLSGKYLYRHFSKYPGQSYTVASLPTFCILSHIAYFTNGKTYERMMEFLNLKSREEILELLPEAISYLKHDSDAALNVTFKVFGNDKEKFCDLFTKTFARIGKGDSGLLNYDRLKEAIKEFNDWFAAQSSYPPKVKAKPNMFQNIKGLLYATSMDLNVSFDHEYNPSALTDIDYHVNETLTIKAPALYGNGLLRYAEIKSLNATVIKFPLKGGKLFAVFFYPYDANNILEMLREIQDPYVYYDALAQTKWMCMKMHIAVGHAYVGNDLMELLPELHLNTTNMHHVYKSGDLAQVNTILQQLHINADTEVRQGPTNSKYCPGNDLPLVKMNHPCAYYVLTKDGLPVYAGVLSGDPEYEN